MRPIIIFEWLTVDGIFDIEPKYFDRWFSPYESDARRARIRETTLGCGALLMGRATYATYAPYWSAIAGDEIADKMNQVDKYVVSTTLEDPSWQNTREVMSSDVASEVARLKEQAGDYILVAGSGMLVRELMRADLVDEYRFLVHPVVMGNGARFFSAETPPTGLELVENAVLDHGVVYASFRPHRIAPATLGESLPE
jgi:dihydrofolate reductase